MRRILFALLLLVSFAGFSQNARADNLAVNFLIDGMPGDPTVPSALYKASQGWMPALGVTLAAGRIDASTGVVSVAPLLIKKPRDNASPALAEAAASGRPFSNAVIDVRPGIAQGQTPYFPMYRILLTGVTVRRFQMAGTAVSGASSNEEVELEYSRIEWQYWISATTMVSRTGWDVAARKAF